MDSKALTTVLIVIICVLLFPLIIGAIAGVFGVLGSIIGGFFGLIGGLIGAIFGIIGGMIGAIFGAFGWIFDEPFHGVWLGGHFDSEDFLAVMVVVLVVVVVTRSNRVKSRR